MAGKHSKAVTEKRKINWLAITLYTVVTLILAGCVAFLISSMVLAKQADLTLVEYWNQLFGIVKQAPGLEDTAGTLLRIPFKI